ncbi:HNH endonuclease [Arenimonas alkanexedens]
MCELNDFSHAEQAGPMPTPCHIPVSRPGRAIRLNRDGYAEINRKVAGCCVTRRAHRVRFEAVRGALQPGQMIDHLCRVRACCNPEHLEPVDAAENVRRGSCTKLTSDDVQAIRALVAAGATQIEAGRRYGVSQGHVSSIVRGKFWADGPCPAWELVKRRSHFV